MHVFIEGPDGVGKTTLIRKLQKSTTFPVIKMKIADKGFRLGSIEDLSYVFNTTLMQFKDYSFIVDRGFLTSLVYSKIFNRQYDFEYINIVNKTLNPVIILLTAKKSTLLERRKKDKTISDDMRSKVYDTYNWLYKQNQQVKKFDIFRVDTTNLTPQQVFEKVDKYLLKRYATGE